MRIVTRLLMTHYGLVVYDVSLKSSLKYGLCDWYLLLPWLKLSLILTTLDLNLSLKATEGLGLPSSYFLTFCKSGFYFCHVNFHSQFFLTLLAFLYNYLFLLLQFCIYCFGKNTLILFRWEKSVWAKNYILFSVVSLQKYAFSLPLACFVFISFFNVMGFLVNSFSVLAPWISSVLVVWYLFPNNVL